jgi:hypothetical protein
MKTSCKSDDEAVTISLLEAFTEMRAIYLPLVFFFITHVVDNILDSIHHVGNEKKASFRNKARITVIGFEQRDGEQGEQK